MNKEALPSNARVKLESERRRVAGRKAARDADYQLIRECEARSVRLVNLLRSTDDEAAQAEYGMKLGDVRAEHGRLVEARERHDAEYRSAMRDFNACEDFIARATGKLRAVPPRPTKYSAEALADKRDEIAALLAEIQQVETAPPDSETRKAEVAATFDATLATAHWETNQFESHLCVGVGRARKANVIEALWWAFPDRRDALLDRLVPPTPGGMPSAAKAEALDRLRSRLLTLKRAEEAIIEAGEATGAFIERLPYVNPLALLGLREVQASEQYAAA